MGRRIRIGVLAVLVSFIASGCPEDEPEWETVSGQGFTLRVEKKNRTYQVGEEFSINVEYLFDAPAEMSYNAPGDSEVLMQSWLGVAIITGPVADASSSEETSPLNSYPAVYEGERRSSQLRGKAKFRCLRVGAGVITFRGTGVYSIDQPNPDNHGFYQVRSILTLDVQVECVASSVPDEPWEPTVLVPVFEIGSQHFPAMQFVPAGTLTFHWETEGGLPGLAIDAPTVPVDDPDPNGDHFGLVDSVTQTWGEYPLTKWVAMCDTLDEVATAANLGYPTLLQEVCATTPTTPPPPAKDGVLVDPCAVISSDMAAATLGNTVTYEEVYRDDTGIMCRYMGPTPVDSAVMNVELTVSLEEKSRSIIDTVFLVPNSYADDNADWVVLNDTDGYFTDDIATGYLVTESSTYAISKGPDDPALGSVAVQFRAGILTGNGQARVLTFVDGYNVMIQATVWLEFPEIEVPNIPLSRYSDAVLEFERQLYAGALAAQPN